MTLFLRSDAEARSLLQQPPKRQKFNAKARDGFGSGKEARRWFELTCLEKAAQIADLRKHPVFLLFAGARFIGRYTADSCYRVNGELIVEDVKGGKATRTTAYMLRRRMVKELYGIQITEV